MPRGISPPSTDIEIISQACSLCGKSSFNTIESGGPFARDAQAFYNTLVSSELGSNRWRFALANVEISNLNTLNPNFDGWLYYFEMPSDAIMFHTIVGMFDYTIFGSKILTKANQKMTAVYSRNVPVSQWPPPFSMYIIYALANMLAASITNSDRMVVRITKDMQRWESRALFADGQNSPIKSMRTRPWIDARWVFRTRG